MSADRDELRRLVEDLPEDRVPLMLAEARKQLTPTAPGPWPPAWFGSVIGIRRDVASRVDEMLAEGFGR
jgi:hypothetical protein